jgi:hypothetical protein
MRGLSIGAAAFLAAIAAGNSVAADPTVGVGVSYVFGEGFAAGVKVFSTDKKDEFAAYAGVDYVFNSRQFRPNLGAAYLFEDAFVGGDIGWNISENVANFAVSGGWADTKSDNGDNNDNTPDNGSESGSGDDSGVDPGDGVEIIPVPDDEFIDPLG